MFDLCPYATTKTEIQEQRILRGLKRAKNLYKHPDHVCLNELLILDMRDDGRMPRDNHEWGRNLLSKNGRLDDWHHEEPSRPRGDSETWMSTKATHPKLDALRKKRKR